MPVDTDDDGIHDRVCWVTWYSTSQWSFDRQGMVGCHNLEFNPPDKEWHRTLEQGSGNDNDEIAVSPPIWMDIDGFGEPEIVVSFGRRVFAYDGNTGLQADINTHWSDALDLPHRVWAAPAAGDLDGDGDMDLLVGDFNGFIQYFENISSGNNLTFSFIENVGNIDLSGNSVPTLGDMDGDGDLDLLIGQLNGSLMFYRNEGSNSQFNFQIDTFDDIQVDNNSAPELVDVDGDDDLDLILGSEEEGILFFQNMGNINNFQFQQSSNLNIPKTGLNVKPTLGQLYDLGTIDIIAGVSTGGVYHLQKEICVLPGDLNGDGSFNVLDIVTLANCVLGGNCAELENGCGGHLNDDGVYNVLDIVLLANCILAQNCGGRIDDAREGALIRKDNTLLLEADGFIGGVQMTLKHSADFSIQLTNKMLHADYLTEGNETRLIIVTPETEELFTYWGEFEIVELIVANSQNEVPTSLPVMYNLSTAYPNPFNPVTTMDFTLPEPENVIVQVYNLQGQVVSTLLSGYQAADRYTLTWEAYQVPSGMYFVKAEAEGFTETQKLMLIK